MERKGWQKKGVSRGEVVEGVEKKGGGKEGVERKGWKGRGG